MDWIFFQFLPSIKLIIYTSKSTCLTSKLNSKTVPVATSLDSHDGSRITFYKSFSYISFPSFTFLGASYWIFILCLPRFPCHFYLVVIEQHQQLSFYYDFRPIGISVSSLNFYPSAIIPSTPFNPGLLYSLIPLPKTSLSITPWLIVSPVCS